MSSLLRFEEVACIRGGRLLFEGVSFAVPAGDALLVQGPNGAGKSSLLRLAAGLLRPAAGRVQRDAAMALADESLALDRELPLRKALGFWARLDGREKELDVAMAAFDLRHLADVPVRMLSTGQARRARLARTLASGAPMWLVDEPLNGLDHASATHLGHAIEAHRHSGGAILAASHLVLPGGEWRILELGR